MKIKLKRVIRISNCQNMTKVLSIPSGKYYDQLTEFKLYVCPQTHKVRDAINKNVSGLLTFRADGGYMERVYKIDGSPLLIKDMNDDILGSLSEAQKNRVFTYLKKSHREQDTELSIYFLNEVEDLPNAPFVKAKDNSGIQNSCYCLLEDLRKGGYIYTTKQLEKLQPNYWWLLANPNVDEDHWNFVDSVRIGEESSYDAKKANGSYKSNFSKVRQGDIVFGYNSGTQNSVVAILKITRETDNRLHFRKELELEKPVSIDTISSDPITKQIDYLTTKCRQKPTLSKITQEQYHALMKLINIENVVQSAKSKNNSIMNSKQPLNQILYGPPGTGKTYNTIYKALDILGVKTPDEKEWFNNPDADKYRKKALDSFRENKDRIVMTTFHQSMSYEDFIEGIKPKIKESEEESLGFRKEKGVFRNICELAEKEFVKGNIDNFDEAWNQLIETLQVDISIKIEQQRNSFSIELNKTEKGLIAKPGNSSVYISKEQLYNVYLGKPGVAKKGNDGYRKLIVQYMTENCDLKTYKHGTQNFDSIKKYVLIIDEINRGNVANIFGELITLIEDDKRTTKWDAKEGKYIENPEGVKVKLPYSGDEFGVPGNLYIIGTMNTADRSVEALDSALRRRFSFTEMMPKPGLLENVRISGVKRADGENANLADLLYTINKRIEILKDREHQIGHSYFMQFTNKEMYPEGVTPDGLKGVFYNKIIPLLQEYFYGDYEKIQKVIGNGFVEKEKEFIPFAANTNENETTTEDLYKITSEPDMNNAIVNLNIQPFQD